MRFLTWLILTGMILCTSISFSYPIRIGVLPFKNSSSFVVYPDKYTVEDVFGRNFTKEVIEVLMLSPRFEVFFADEDAKSANYLVGGNIVRCFFHTSHFIGTSGRAGVWVEAFMIKDRRIVFKKLFVGEDRTYSPIFNPKTIRTWSDLYHTALGGAVRKAAVRIADEVSAYLPLVGRVVGVTENGNAIVDIGKKDGVKMGMIFELRTKTRIAKKKAVWGKVKLRYKVVALELHRALLRPLLAKKKSLAKRGDILIHGVYP